MMPLWKRKRKTRGARYAHLVDQDPLNAVPRVPDGVEHRADDDGCLQLRYVPPPETRVQKFFANTLKLPRTAVRLNLDQRGSFFWQLIDGERDLHTIAKRLRRKFNLTAEKAEEATILFIKDLMLRGLVYLEVNRRETADR